jgi:hypothetical protein
MVFNQIEHLIKMASDFKKKLPMVFSQIKHLIKMASDL